MVEANSSDMDRRYRVRVGARVAGILSFLIFAFCGMIKTGWGDYGAWSIGLGAVVLLFGTLICALLNYLLMRGMQGALLRARPAFSAADERDYFLSILRHLLLGLPPRWGTLEWRATRYLRALEDGGLRARIAAIELSSQWDLLDEEGADNEAVNELQQRFIRMAEWNSYARLAAMRLAETPVWALFSAIVRQAAEDRVTKIRVEFGKGFRVLFLKDEWVEVMSGPASLEPALVGVMKFAMRAGYKRLRPYLRRSRELPTHLEIVAMDTGYQISVQPPEPAADTSQSLD